MVFSSDKDNTKTISSHVDSLDNDHRAGERFLFQPDTLGSAINSLISLSANIFSIWQWAETRDDLKREKEPSSSEVVGEELSEQLQDLQHQVDEKLKVAVLQMTCRLDAVYIKGNIVRPECLQFVKPDRVQPSASLTKLEKHKQKHVPFHHILS